MLLISFFSGIIKHWWAESITLKACLISSSNEICTSFLIDLIGKAHLAVKGWLCKLKQILQFIKHALHVRRARKHDIPFLICSLPPKSGLNRMSYPFISLSTVSFTKGILLGSLISLTLWRKRWCNAKQLINITRQALFNRGYMTSGTDDQKMQTFTFESRRKSLVRKKSKSQSGFSWSSPSQQFLRWFRDASEESAHPTYSRQCRGANEGRMRTACPRSKSGDWWWWMSSFHCREKY